ncbi:MAG: YdiU family protein [Campylobacterota bacterium]|nr:YdiU family protein [Campylobacterota bacterium]
MKPEQKNKKNLQNIEVINSYLEFNNKFYDNCTITPLNHPLLASKNKKLFDEIGIDFDTTTNEDIIDILNGKQLLKGSKPYAMVYAGHQFGFYVEQLGDGRAINIGSFNNHHFALKGSGLTKYSRNGDGKAVLRSSIREYLMSEHLNALGIESTRALAIISSNHRVYRDLGHEKGSIVLRVSPSWIRFGTFEYYYNNGTKDDIRQLADFVIEQNYPDLKDLGKNIKYEYLFLNIVERTAKMIALWQCYGFMHGVMNTDNMSVAGVTIDYGPYAFMDNFKADTICNHTDKQGRYSYSNQPFIAKWNLSCLAVAISPIVKNKQKLNEYVQIFESLERKEYYSLMNKRIGLDENISNDGNRSLIDDMLICMENAVVDYNLFFKTLEGFNKQDILDICTYRDEISSWLDKYLNIIEEQNISKEKIKAKMDKINPKYILKNYIIQEVIDDANEDDFKLLNELLNIGQNPFDEHQKFERYSKATPNEFSNIKLSCSS